MYFIAELRLLMTLCTLLSTVSTYHNDRHKCTQVGWDTNPEVVNNPCHPVLLFSHEGDASTRIVVHQEGLDVLRSAKAPVSIATVAGRARSGKSFTMNNLIGVRSEYGFVVGHTDRPETLGAYVWPVPIIADDGKTSVFIVDTEGLGTGPATFDKALLLMATLVSDILVYHVSDMVYTDDVTRLYGMAFIADDCVTRGLLKSVHLPRIAMVVQRFSLDTSWRDISDVAERDYAVVFDGWMAERACVDHGLGGSDCDDVAQFNFTVRLVKHSFRGLSAHLFPIATDDSTDTVKITTIPTQRLPYGYTSALARLRSEILATRPVDMDASGADVANLIESIIPAANERVDVLGDRVATAVLSGRISSAVKRIANVVDSISYPSCQREVDAIILAAIDTEERNAFSGMVTGAVHAATEARAVFATSVALERERANTINSATSESTCTLSRTNAETYISSMMGSHGNIVGSRKFQMIVYEALHAYDKNAVGPAAAHHRSLLESFIAQKEATVSAQETPKIRFSWLVGSITVAILCHIIASIITSLCGGSVPAGAMGGAVLSMYFFEIICVSVAFVVVATMFASPPVTIDQIHAFVVRIASTWKFTLMAPLIVVFVGAIIQISTIQFTK